MEIKTLLIYNINSSNEKTKKEAKQMTKLKSLYYSLAAFSVMLLNMIMLICANSNSCAMVHQPKAPEALNRYSKIK